MADDLKRMDKRLYEIQQEFEESEARADRLAVLVDALLPHISEDDLDREEVWKAYEECVDNGDF